MRQPDPRAGYADEALRAEVARVGWYHAIPLRRDLVTPGLNQPQRRLARLALPDRLDGKSVIDVGTWDGYFAFEAERRGAEFPAVGQLLRAAGFSDVRLIWPGRSSYPWSIVRAGYGLARSVRSRLRHGTPLLPNALSWRAVFHARP